MHGLERPGPRPLPVITGFEFTWWSELDGKEPTADTTTDAAIAWLEQERSGPFFLWIHYLDPHGPYAAETLEAAGSYWAAYEVVLAYTDREVRRLLEYLQRFDDVAVVLTADHGEAFGEHGSFFHSSTVFDEQTRVASYVCTAPAAAATHEAPVSHIDIAPTILALTGNYALRPASFHGWVLPDSGAEATTPAFTQTVYERGSIRAVIDWPWKLIHFTREDGSLLFDLAADPDELHDLSAGHPSEVARLECLLDAWEQLNHQD